MTLLEKLLEIRRKKALSWVFIAEQIGICRPALDRFRNGGVISELTLLKITNWVEKNGC
jgi:hypothetical protein